MTRNFTIQGAVERYLKERKPDVAAQTLYNHRSALRVFQRFCDDEGIENVSDIDGFLVSDFRLQRLEEVTTSTVYNNLTSVKGFVRWCENRDLLEENVSEGMVFPTRYEDTRDTSISPERAQEIFDYLDTYEYSSRRHALFSLLWDTGIRIGAARSLDIDHFSSDGKYILLKHRPEADVPLKNKRKSEREVNLHSWVAKILEDYIEGKRLHATDDYGNNPLFSTENGRAHRTTLRKEIVMLTRPCFYSNECPHDREIGSCEANTYNGASKCPSSIAPHTLRRSAITYWLDDGYSKELLSDRMDVSVETLEKHYDARSEEQKRELRREMLDIE